MEAVLPWVSLVKTQQECHRQCHDLSLVGVLPETEFLEKGVAY